MITDSEVKKKVQETGKEGAKVEGVEPQNKIMVVDKVLPPITGTKTTKQPAGHHNTEKGPEPMGVIQEIPKGEATTPEVVSQKGEVEINPEAKLDTTTEKNKAIHAGIKAIEGSNFYWKKIGVILLIVFATLVIIVLRGGKGMKSVIGSENCAVSDIFITLGYIIIVLILFVLAYLIIRKEATLKTVSKWNFHKDELKLTDKFIFSGFGITFLVGFLAVNIGIGGGLLLTPFLLGLGMLPQVISFTGMYMTILKCVVSVTIFIISGDMPIDYFLIMGVVIALGVFVVEWRVAILVKSMGRQSIIVFLFSAIIFGSWLLVLYSTATKFNGFGEFIEFSSYCV